MNNPQHYHQKSDSIALTRPQEQFIQSNQDLYYLMNNAVIYLAKRFKGDSISLANSAGYGLEKTCLSIYELYKKIKTEVFGFYSSLIYESLPEQPNFDFLILRGIKVPIRHTKQKRD